MNTFKHFAGKRYEWLQFFLFVACYVLLDYSYFKIPVDVFINVIYYQGVVRVCADVINLIAPQEQVSAMHNHLLSSKADLEIVNGCDGAGVIFLLISAILVFPATIYRKLSGLFFGVGLIYVINLVRIATLYFTFAYQPAWFTLVHTYLAPTLMVIMASTYFAWWALAISNKRNEPA
ncbi:exosortase family protein XrtM [Methylomonas sp. AM2-LC]|uniref:exosortase family protein XrtM n=1 Tax=Methylomonas sp. AM2-LC TaxID=3153301 RepID=UPI003265C50E